MHSKHISLCFCVLGLYCQSNRIGSAKNRSVEIHVGYSFQRTGGTSARSSFSVGCNMTRLHADTSALHQGTRKQEVAYVTGGHFNAHASSARFCHLVAEWASVAYKI